jgi:exodeoxyribonuclease VII large subunit
LWAFNEEIVARSIYASNIPVISAVGHETDYTIADFVADLRAPTPSAAAEIVVPEKGILKDRIKYLNMRLQRSLSNQIKINRTKVEKLTGSIVFRQPYDRVYQERMRLELLNKYAYRGLQGNMARIKSDFGNLVGKLDALSPLNILSRGYSIVKSKENGHLIKSAAMLKSGDEIEIGFNDGKVGCTVNDIKIKG